MSTSIREHNLRAALLWAAGAGIVIGRTTAGIWKEKAVSESSGWQLASGSVAEASERYLMSTFGYAWTQALVQLAAPQEGERVLDVACGTGPVARYIAPFVGSSGRVVGLDLNSGMLDTARAMPILRAFRSSGERATRRRCHF